MPACALPILLALVAVMASGCRNAPLPGAGGETRAPTSPEEFEHRIGRIELLVAEGRGEQALAEIGETLREWPPEPFRQRLNRLAYEIRRDRFYRDHPLHLSLELDRARYLLDEVPKVRLRVTNLGPERLRLPASWRSWTAALTFQEPEQSVLFLRVTARDADGRGSHWATESLVEVPLERDLELAPGGSDVIVAALELPSADRSAFRLVRVGAIFRPLAILSETGERRYDPLEFPVASARLFRREHGHWAEGGLPLLAACVDPEASGSPEALFVAAVGLAERDLHEGIDLLARAAPSLDLERRRGAIAALALLTGNSFADDPVRFLGWWQQEGVRLGDEELLERAGLAAGSAGGALAVGAGS